MAPAPCHLVGSFPAPDASTSFSKCCSALKGKLSSVPDGETGWRWNFTMGLVQKFAAANPAIGAIWRDYDDHYDPKPVQPLSADEIAEMKKAVQATDWTIGYVDDAKASYATFLQLRDQGIIEQGVRFQVCLPGISSVALWVKPALQYPVEDLLYTALQAETAAIVAAIPPADLALQTDIASDFIMCEAQAHPEVLATLREDFHPPQEDALERYSRQHAGILDLLPDEVDAGLHICMGNLNNKAILPAKGTDTMVELANRIVAKTRRRVQWMHFGALPEWTDPKFYAPLSTLQDKDMAVYVGLVYPHDAEGAKKRVEAVRSVLPDFGIAPPCGLARMSEKDAESVLSLLRELSVQS